MGTNEQATNTLTFQDYVDLSLMVIYTKAGIEAAHTNFSSSDGFKQQRIEELNKLLIKLYMLRDSVKGAAK